MGYINVPYRRINQLEVNYMPRNTNARAVAKKVIEQIKNKERPNMKKAMLESGYSKISAECKAKEIRNRPDFKEEMMSFEEQLDELIADGIDIMKTKKQKATYRDGIESVEKMKKLKLLVTGNPTDNQKVTIGWK